MGKRLNVEIGKRYERLVILKDLGIIKPNENARYKVHFVLCKCDCGTIKRFSLTEIVNSKTMSCGCYSRDMVKDRMTKHNGSNEHRRLYNIWKGMRKRCNNPNANTYRFYGAKGISVCEEWENLNHLEIGR